jgi:hypothetical protein
MKEILLSWQRAVVLSGIALMFMASLLGMRTASAQTMQDRVDGITEQMKQLQELSAKLSASVKNSLSSGAHHLLHMAEKWDKIAPQLTQTAATFSSSVNTKSFTSGDRYRPVQYRTRAQTVLSRLAGFVQNETSTAWCGDTVVVAFNDTGSMLETLPDFNIGPSLMVIPAPAMAAARLPTKATCKSRGIVRPSI